MDEADIQGVWMKCLDEAGKTWMALGMEVVQYEAEKAFWEIYCRNYQTTSLSCNDFFIM